MGILGDLLYCISAVSHILGHVCAFHFYADLNNFYDTWLWIL